MRYFYNHLGFLDAINDDNGVTVAVFLPGEQLHPRYDNAKGRTEGGKVSKHRPDKVTPVKPGTI